MIGIFACSAILASATVLARSSRIGTSLTVWNRPVWWSSSRTTVSFGSSRASRAAALGCRERPSILGRVRGFLCLRASGGQCQRSGRDESPDSL